MPRILLVTGEASGDLHGANLARELKTLRPDVDLIGVGGTKMQEAGVVLLPGIERLDGSKVIFTDGSAEEIDLLIWATGFRPSLRNSAAT